MTPGAFFRESGHFELLARSVLPAFAQRTGSVRLWSAGCGSGEEAWSLAMIVEEAELPAALDVALIASDGDPQMIARASEAVYVDGAMHGVNAARRRRHFVRGVGPRAGLWRVCASLRDRVDFVELDLLGPWPDRGPFDVVMCHGAFAGMNPRTGARLVRRFTDALAPGGVMLLGPVRPDSGETPRLEPYGSAGYRKIA